MKKARWLLALLAVLCAGAGARAQGLNGVGANGPTGTQWTKGSGSPYPKSHRPHTIVIAGSPGWGGYFGYPSYSLPVSRVTVYYYSPPVVLGPSSPFLSGLQRLQRETDQNLELRLRRPVAEAPQGLADGAPASVFRPIRPEDRRRAGQPEAPPLPKPPEPLEPKKDKKPELPRQRAPMREMPLPPVAEGKIESARQMDLGREAFALREYARAERRFQQAVAASPGDPLAYFLLAQAQYALGKYQEAVVSIEAGMRLQPDWPTAHFRPRELYGMNQADYADHWKRLTDALARYPTDPFLVFLYAYQLWFDDRQWEARSYFQRARALAPDPQPSERFLRALPSFPILVW